VIHEKSRLIIERNQQEPNQRSARSLLKNKFSDPRSVTLRTESLAGFGRNPGPVEL
jgi:hypothetical protein